MTPASWFDFPGFPNDPAILDTGANCQEVTWQIQPTTQMVAEDFVPNSRPCYLVAFSRICPLHFFAFSLDKKLVVGVTIYLLGIQGPFFARFFSFTFQIVVYMYLQVQTPLRLFFVLHEFRQNIYSWKKKKLINLWCHGKLFFLHSCNDLTPTWSAGYM